MKIALIAPVEETVPPRKYGGTELIVNHLANHLTRRGHEVYLYASGDSKTAARLVPLVPQAIRVMTQSDEGDKEREVWKYIAVSNFILEMHQGKKFDIIHQHFGWRITPFEHSLDVPVVATCHGPLDPDYIRLVYGKYKSNNYITISNAQRKSQPNLNYVATVYNGIDISQFTYSDKKGDYYAFLGRMSPEKGPKEAILAAKKANVKLLMAAKIDNVDRQYYSKEIKPLIDGKQIKYVGEVGPRERDKLLGGAKALLALIQWNEPFGLYFVEAMAVGTPVIAVERGSAPEIITDEVNGLLVPKNDTVDQAVEAMSKIEKMDKDKYKAMRRACREHVEKNFTVEKMVDGYEKVYGKVIADWKNKKH